MTVVRFAEPEGVKPGQARIGKSGAKGIRTPDLLVANETRYRLRHSPEDRLRADQHADFTIRYADAASRESSPSASA